MLVSKFYARRTKQKLHQQRWLDRMSQERFRGVVRGAAQRERLLHPSAAKSMQRRTRVRLVASYIRRFGSDDFSRSLGQHRFATRATLFWLPSGYAWWKERVLGHGPERPFK